MIPATAARRAEALGSRLPPLLVAALRVANTVAQGVHGRRRVGQGDSFWQYRPFLAGDSPSRIDWRASGKSDRAYIRETEWEAAQTVYLWRDASPSMDWRSGAAVPLKRERAEHPAPRHRRPPPPRRRTRPPLGRPPSASAEAVARSKAIAETLNEVRHPR